MTKATDIPSSISNIAMMPPLSARLIRSSAISYDLTVAPALMVEADEIEQVDNMLVAGQGDVDEKDGGQDDGSEASRVEHPRLQPSGAGH
jgi:hypothetical protein